MRTVLHAWLCGRLIEVQSSFSRKKLHRMNQGSNYLGGSYNNRDFVRVPIALIQFNSGRQPQHFKKWFFLKYRPTHFHIIGTSINRPVKQNKLRFSSIETSKPLLLLIRYLIILRVESIIISIDSNVTDNIITTSLT